MLYSVLSSSSSCSDSFSFPNFCLCQACRSYSCSCFFSLSASHHHHRNHQHVYVYFYSCPSPEHSRSDPSCPSSYPFHHHNQHPPFLQPLHYHHPNHPSTTGLLPYHCRDLQRNHVKRAMPHHPFPFKIVYEGSYSPPPSLLSPTQRKSP